MFLVKRYLLNDLFSIHRELESLFEHNWNSLGRALPETAAHGGGYFPGN